MRQFLIEVTQVVRVELDEAKFDEDFMQEFRESFYPFFDLDEHAEHIAQLKARGLADFDFYRAEFVEGYGPIADMGITASIVSTETEVREPS